MKEAIAGKASFAQGGTILFLQLLKTLRGDWRKKAAEGSWFREGLGEQSDMTVFEKELRETAHGRTWSHSAEEKGKNGVL